MIKSFLLLIALLLAGCATQPNVVYVPTPVKCPAPKIPPEPKYLPITQSSTPAQYVKAMTVNLKMCRDTLAQCRMTMEGYRHE